MVDVSVASSIYLPGLQLPGHKDKTYDWRAPVGSPENTRGVAPSCVRVPLEDALVATYTTDAHCFAWTVPGMDAAPRLTKAALDWFTGAAGVVPEVAVFFADVDNPEHAPWSDALREDFERLWAACAPLQSAGVYFSKRGLRVVQPLAAPLPVTASEAYHRRWLRQLEAAGLAVDWACKDWTRYFRLPNVRRDGLAYRSPVIRLERMRPVELAPLPPDVVESERRRARTRSTSAVAVSSVEWASSVPPHWNGKVMKLAAAIRETEGSWHALFLALAGALCDVGVTPELVPAICVAVSHATGADARPDDRERGARSTVEKYLARSAHTGLRDLVDRWPPVAAAVQSVGARGGVAQLFRAASAVDDAQPMPLAQATAALEQVLRTAPDGVTVIRAACGLGKALSLDTPIPTPSGWTTMGDLRVGDTVFDERGQACSVTFATEVMHGRECFDVVFDDGTVIVADAEHLWLTTSKRARDAANKRAAHARNGRDPGAAPKHVARVVTTTEIRDTLTAQVSPTRTERNHAVAVTAPIQTPEAALPVDPYVLGVWLGDGHSDGCRVTSADPEIIEELRRSGAWVGEGRPDPRSRAVLYEVRLGELASRRQRDRLATSLTYRLRALGVLGNKHVPTGYLRASAAQRLSLLQGLMDTDGYVTNGGTCEFSVCSEALARGFHELCLSLGFRATMREDAAVLRGVVCGTRYRIAFTPHVPVFRLPRKLARQSATELQRGRTTQRFIVDVRPRESVPVRCITVDSPSHLYLASRSFIPTHNTTAAERVAVERSRKEHATFDADPSRAPLGSKTAISVDKHELAAQVVANLEAAGASAKRYFGPLSLRRSDGTYECRFREAALPLVNGGQSMVRELCEGRGRAPCPHKDQCRAWKGVEGPEDARIAVGPHALVHQLDAFAGSTGLLVIDEPPALLDGETFTSGDLDAARAALASFRPRYVDAMLPALQALAAWTREAGPLDTRATLADVVAAACDAVDPEALIDACSAAGVDPNAGDFASRVVACVAGALPDTTRSVAPPIRFGELLRARSSAPFATVLGNASRVLLSLYLCATAETAPVLRLDETAHDRVLTVTKMRDGFAEALRRQGACVVTDANADLHVPVIERVVGYEPRYHRFAVRDGAPVARTVLRSPNANRKGWFAHGRLVLEAGPVAAVAEAIAWAQEDRDARTLAIITYQPLRIAIEAAAYGIDERRERAWKDTGHTSRELKRAVARLAPVVKRWKGRLLVGHYQALRGLNAMKDADALATLGDPWPNLGDVRHASAFLGLEDWEGRFEAMTRAELEQAHGRLRTVHRSKPARALHVGAVMPGGSGWCEGQVDVRLPENGRPRGDAMTASEFAALRADLGATVAQLAEMLGTTRQSIARYESGERGVSHAVAVKLRTIADSRRQPANDVDPKASLPVTQCGRVG